MASTTIPAMPAINSGPAATIMPALMDAPSSSTATSSSVLALKLIPAN